MRTLIATVLYNSKGKEIYCSPKKISEQDLKIIKDSSRDQLEDAGFTYISLVSPDFSNVKGFALFFEGHLDEMSKILKALKRGY